MNKEKLDETFKIISEKHKILKDKLVSVETDYLNSEVNLAVCTVLIKTYKEEIEKEKATYK